MFSGDGFLRVLRVGWENSIVLVFNLISGPSRPRPTPTGGVVVHGGGRAPATLDV